MEDQKKNEINACLRLTECHLLYKLHVNKNHCFVAYLMFDNPAASLGFMDGDLNVWKKDFTV